MKHERGDFWRIKFNNEEMIETILSAEHDLQDGTILSGKWYSAILEHAENDPENVSQVQYFDFVILAETLCPQVRILASEMNKSDVSAYCQPMALSPISVSKKLASFYDIYQMTDESQLLERIKELENERDKLMLTYNKQIEAFTSKLNSMRNNKEENV